MEFNSKQNKKKIIIEKIHIEPKYLNSNISNIIVELLKKKYNNKCIKNCGYIISIEKLLSYNNNIISNSNPNVIFDIKYEMMILEPYVGMKLLGPIILIFEEGLLVKIRNNLKILIKKESIFNYKLTNDGCEYSDNIEMCNGDNIKIEITKMKFEKNRYTCIGKFLELM